METYQKMILMHPQEVENIFLNSLRKYGIKPTVETQRIYTVNQAAKKLGMAHNTVSKHIKEGLLKTTAGGRVTESAIEEYLNGGH